MGKVLLIDSNSLMHRAYHALPQLRSSKGQYTGAIYGFLNLLLRLIKEVKPTHIAAAFDLHGKTFRHLMYDQYKGTRKPMDEELRCQVEPLKDLITKMGITICSLQGYEGDDILGTLSNKFKDQECIIVTGDRDSFQLVSENTCIYWTKKGVSDIEVVTVDSLLQDGFTTSQFIDYKALRGDTSDNIPGIAGVGEKTAKQLLETYGSLDSVLDHADEIKGKLGEGIRANKEIALLSRELATICLNAPVDVTLDDFKFVPIYSQEVKTLLSEYEITSLIPRMEFEENKEIVPVREINHIEIASSDEMKKVLENAKEVAFLLNDTLSFAVDEENEYKVCVSQDLFSQGMFLDDAIESFKELTKDKLLVCYDYKSLYHQYHFSADNFFDVMIAAHLCRDSATIKNVETIVGIDNNYASSLMLYYHKFKDEIEQKQLHTLFYDVEQPLCLVLAKMEERGICVDIETLNQLEEIYANKLNEIMENIYLFAGEKFNIASTKQLGEILFEKLGLRHGKKTKTGYSVSEDVLMSILYDHPIVPYLLEYRHYSKLLSTYVVGLKPLVVNGKIHTEFNQCITATGRLSSTNPNLQNLPAKGEDAKEIKKAFIASKDHILVSADYSQIELRVLAHMSEDEQLMDAFKNGDDIHAITASSVFHVPMDEITPEQRRNAKAINFGIVYGISGYGLSENLTISPKQAKEYIDNYFTKHPKVKAYMNQCIEDAKSKGYAVTLLNRRRDLQDIKSSNFMIRSSAERMAMNTPIQGSAADIIKMAMIRVENRLKDYQSKLILQIHDELIIDAAIDEMEEVEKILSEEMEHAVKLLVPLIAQATHATCWSDLK